MLWKIVQQFFKKKLKIKLPFGSATSLLGISKRTENKDLCRYLYICVQSDIVHSSQKVERNQWMDKWNMVHTYNEILFSPKKEGILNVWYNIDEPWGHYAMENKPVTKMQILYNFTDMSTWGT